MPDFLIILSLVWGLMLGIVMITEISNPLFNLSAIFLVIMPLLFYKQMFAIAEGGFYIQWLFIGFFLAFLVYVASSVCKHWQLSFKKE